MDLIIVLFMFFIVFIITAIITKPLRVATDDSNLFDGLYQDADGKIPVTDYCQPVGRIKSTTSDEILLSKPGHEPIVIKDSE